MFWLSTFEGEIVRLFRPKPATHTSQFPSVFLRGIRAIVQHEGGDSNRHREGAAASGKSLPGSSRLRMGAGFHCASCARESRVPTLRTDRRSRP